MRKIETLLELWEYKCEMCSAEKSENSDNETPSIKLMDLIRTRADATNFDYVKHIRSAEEFSTQILCKLLNDIEAFQLEFLQQIGLFAECNKENFNKLVVEAEYSVGKKRKAELFSQPPETPYPAVSGAAVVAASMTCEIRCCCGK